MRILVTRPVEDGEETARQLALRGHQSVLAPLLTTEFWDGPEVALEGVQAILATSANGAYVLKWTDDGTTTTPTYTTLLTAASNYIYRGVATAPHL